MTKKWARCKTRPIFIWGEMSADTDVKCALTGA